MKRHKPKKNKFSLKWVIISVTLLILGVATAYLYNSSAIPPLIAGIDGGVDTLSGKSTGRNIGTGKGDAAAECANNGGSYNSRTGGCRKLDDDKSGKAGDDLTNQINNTVKNALKALRDKCATDKGIWSEATKSCTYPKGISPVPPTTPTAATIYTEGVCPGAGSNIGGGQWAQTGGGVEGSDVRYCVQCGGARKDGKAGPGVWGDTQEVCGQGNASSYITRPDEVLDCKDPSNTNKTPNCTEGKVQGACWRGGTWYADTSANGNDLCFDGSWKNPVEYKELMAGTATTKGRCGDLGYNEATFQCNQTKSGTHTPAQVAKIAECAAKNLGVEMSILQCNTYVHCSSGWQLESDGNDCIAPKNQNTTEITKAINSCVAMKRYFDYGTGLCHVSFDALSDIGKEKNENNRVRTPYSSKGCEAVKKSGEMCIKSTDNPLLYVIVPSGFTGSAQSNVPTSNNSFSECVKDLPDGYTCEPIAGGNYYQRVANADLPSSQRVFIEYTFGDSRNGQTEANGEAVENTSLKAFGDTCNRNSECGSGMCSLKTNAKSGTGWYCMDEVNKSGSDLEVGILTDDRLKCKNDGYDTGFVGHNFLAAYPIYQCLPSPVIQEPVLDTTPLVSSGAITEEDRVCFDGKIPDGNDNCIDPLEGQLPPSPEIDESNNQVDDSPLGSNYQIFMQTGELGKTSININNVQTACKDDKGNNISCDTTMRTSGCGPATLLNILNYLEKAPFDTDQENLDYILNESNFYIACTGSGCASGADSTLKVLQTSFGYDGAFSDMKDTKITDANKLENADGVFVYQGEVKDPNVDGGRTLHHNVAFVCEEGKCQAMDSYVGDGKPSPVCEIKSDSLQCGSTKYSVDNGSKTESGNPAVFYPVPGT